MKLYMTKKEWEDWVANTYCKACAFMAENSYVTGEYIHKRSTTDSPIKHIYYILNTNTGRIGIAKCNEKRDKFVHEVGIVIAYQRYMNLPIPRIAEEVDVNSIKIGDTVVLGDDVYTYCGYYQGDHKFAPVGSTTITKTVRTYIGITFRKLVD